MLDAFAQIAAACDLSVPEQLHRPIAVIGAGAIVRHGHLPAYRDAGLPIVGIYDLDTASALDLCQQFDLDRVLTLEQILQDVSIEVVDVAVVPEAQPAIVKELLAAGKHVLAQKPLAMTSALGAELVEEASSSERVLVVNQQMRYGEGIAAMRAIAESGWLGELTALTIDVDINTDWTAWSWLVRSERLDLLYHSIHYFDSIRSIFGTPTKVFCTSGRRPGQTAAGETRTMTTMVFPGGRRAHVNVNHENITGDCSARIRLDGAEGSVRNTIGLLYDYPSGRPDTVEVYSRVLPTDGWLPYPVTTRWIPDAFIGPMRALLEQIANGTPAPTSGRDSLNTLRVVEACYASIERGDAVALPGDGAR